MCSNGGIVERNITGCLFALTGLIAQCLHETRGGYLDEGWDVSDHG